MSNTLTFEGLDDLRAALRALPADLAQEAGDVIVETVNNAADEIVAAYPDRTGHLRGGVKFSVERSDFGVIGTVKNTANLAWIFELGSQARHTELGANRGSMPPGHVFVPIVMKRRRQMFEELKTVLEKQGLEVSGDA
jgi:hypothetical protein